MSGECNLEFTVIDIKTGEYPDVEKIALKEEWAQGLIYCDIDGFYIGEDGVLILMDDCGNARYCPSERFEIVFENDKSQPRKVDVGENGNIYCPSCKRKIGAFHGRNYCPDCGQKIDWGEAK